MQTTSTVKLLEWWKINKTKYKYLYKVHKVINCVPATMAASERAFSECGNLITPLRTNLNAEKINNLVVTNSNLKLNEIALD